MNHNVETEQPDRQITSTSDLSAIYSSVRRTHAQIRLITAANFAAFIELSRSEQRDALLALLDSSEATIDMLDQLLEQINPDQG